MSELYFLHHAPVPKRPCEIIGSGTDLELDKYGYETAHRYAERVNRMLGSGALKNAGGLIIASTLKRAIQSAEVLAEHTGFEVQTDARLRAQHFGVLEQKTPEEILANPDLAPHLWDNIPPNKRLHYRAPGAESSNDIRKRVIEARNEILKSGDNPIVVTHGSSLDAIISYREGIRFDEAAGSNRAYEGRIIRDSHKGFEPLGQSGEQFAHIPGVEAALRRNDIEGVRKALRIHAARKDVAAAERSHISKLTNHM